MKTVKHLLTVLLPAVIAVALFHGCAPYLSEGNEPCPCKDGWKCCWDVCFPLDYPCSQDAGSDDGDAGGGDTGSDSGQDKSNWPYCPCKNRSDVVDPNSDWCYRKGYTCNALNPCDDGYECHQYCYCRDVSICGLDCSTGCSCPYPLVCDEKTGTCRVPQGCLDDSMCDNGFVCREAPHSPELPTLHRMCTRPSGAEVGQQCEEGWQCYSGVCDHSHICLQACESSVDCPAGQFCHEADFSTLGCVVETQCEPSCDGVDEYCTQGGDCRDDNCRTHADCPGDCTILFSSPVIGQCTDDSSLCEDDEFLVKIDNKYYCIIYRSCWTDLDCEGQYRCSSELWGPTDQASYCGRLVGGRCEDDCPAGTSCDYRTASCEEALYCLEDAMCPQGMECSDGAPTVDGHTCAVPRGGELGEPCRYPSDCRSGVCSTPRVCVQSCRTNSDCPGGQFCSEVGWSNLGCLAQTQCGPSCSGPDEFCDGTECRAINCDKGADCPGDCTIYVTHPDIGLCIDSTICDDTEFVSGPVAFCMIHQSCRSDEDCIAPYRCITGEDHMVTKGPSFCGRQP